MEMTKQDYLIITSLAVAAFFLGLLFQHLVYGWPAGTTEAQKDKILSVTSDDNLTLDEHRIAEERVYEIFDTLQTKEEFDEFDICGFSAAEDGFKVLQCWEDKGHTVR